MTSSLADYHVSSAAKVLRSGFFIEIAAEALSRYKLRTSLSVLGVVLGVAAVIAMMSVSEGARREALNQVQALGLDNLVARSRGVASTLSAGDAQRLGDLVPLTRAVSPLIERYVRVSNGDRAEMTRVLGVHASYETILRLRIERGRFLSAADERASAHVSVLGGTAARRLFGYRDPIGEQVRIGSEYYQVVGVLREQGVDPQSPGALAWRDVNTAAMVPLPALSACSSTSTWYSILSPTKSVVFTVPELIPDGIVALSAG